MSGGVVLSQRGFRFSANQDLLVTEFGKNEPNGTNRTMVLWNYPGASQIHQQTVAGAASVYTYDPIADPIWLSGGTEYLLTLQPCAKVPLKLVFHHP